MSIANELKRTTLKTAFHYLEKDPEKNAVKLMDLVDKFAGSGPDSFPKQREAFRNVLEDPQNNMYQLIMSVLKDIDRDVLKATFENFFFNANIVGWPKQEENRKKYGCNIPWAILLDPTSACNLHCTGCWAAEYGNKLNLTFDEIDSIITQDNHNVILGGVVFLAELYDSAEISVCISCNVYHPHPPIPVSVQESLLSLQQPCQSFHRHG